VRHLIAVGAVSLATALAGCGGDDEGNQETSQPAGAAVETVDVTETEFKLDPANPTIDKTGEVVFRVANEGSIEHSLEVEGPSGESELEKNVKPGESATLSVNLDKPGKYEWYCPVGNHRQQGMEGQVSVAGGGEAAKPESKNEPQDTGSGGY
jgi:uncharacterized cupredoxin-like copper-binding protein